MSKQPVLSPETFTWLCQRITGAPIRDWIEARESGTDLDPVGRDSSPESEYIFFTFPIANRRDPELAKRAVYACDRIAKAIEPGEPFGSMLDPRLWVAAC